MVNSSISLQSQSVRLTLQMTSLLWFGLWASDIQKAYFQSSDTVALKSFINNLVQEFEISPEQCFQLPNSLHGLCNTGELWHCTLHKHYRPNRWMSPVWIYPALYYCLKEGKLNGLSGTYVDDIFRVGDINFCRASNLISKRFNCKSQTSFLLGLHNLLFIETRTIMPWLVKSHTCSNWNVSHSIVLSKQLMICVWDLAGLNTLMYIIHLKFYSLLIKLRKSLNLINSITLKKFNNADKNAEGSPISLDIS